MEQKIAEIVKSINGRRKDRTIGEVEVSRLMELVAENQDNPEVKKIRVYSRHGFVANAYKWRAEISVLEANRGEDGQFVIIGFTTDAKRGHGNGALVTINGRAS